MADIQHKNIVDPNIHEPKGVKFAAKDTAYIADGNGSGAWKEILLPGFSLSSETLVVSLSGSMSGPGLVASGVFPAGFTALENNAPSIGVYSNYLNITKSGVYFVIPEISVGLSTGGTPLSMTVSTSFSRSSSTKSAVSPIAPTLTLRLAHPETSVSGGIVRMMAISLSAGDNLCLWKTGYHSGTTSVSASISGHIQIIKLPDGV